MKYLTLQLVVFLCGAIVMAFEIMGSRILGVYVGTSIFVWTSIIGIILASLSFGYWLGGRVADRYPSFFVLGIVILLSGFCIAITNLVKHPFLELISGPGQDIRTVSVISSLTLFSIPAILLGMVSPYAVRLKMISLNKSASTVGNLYAISTFGSIVGTFLAGFFLIPSFPVSTIMYLLAGLLLILSLLIFVIYGKNKKFNFLQIVFIGMIIVFFFSCDREKQESQPLKLAISKGMPNPGYEKYHDWIHQADSSIIIHDMYQLGVDSALLVLENCDGLFLTGGEDVHPNRYSMAFDSILCGLPDHRRDSIELALIDKAMHLEIPILGICRGEQILNIALGGSLYFDLPVQFDTMVHHRKTGYQRTEHKIKIVDKTLIHEITGVNFGNVNSNHHQAVKNLAPGLTASAFSEDGLTEAIELEDYAKKPFLLGVQWHPEHMDFDSPLSGTIAVYFVNKMKMNKNPINK